jgi:uncharacterized protein (DUF952 family)
MLLHITEQSEWEAARDAGRYAPTTLATEGFIHLSTPEQVLFPANSFYRGRSGLVLLVLDPERLTAEVRHEDTTGHGEFPHLYGPLNLDAVTAVLPFEPEEDGTFSPPNLPGS